VKILLFKGKTVISRFIRWQTRSPYSHAALLLDDGRSIIESVEGAGVRERFLTEDDAGGFDAFMVPGLSPTQAAAVISFARAQLGRKYDYWAIIRFIDRERMPENDRWFCSELVFQAFDQAGVKLLVRIDSWAVSPGMLALSPLLL